MNWIELTRTEADPDPDYDSSSPIMVNADSIDFTEDFDGYTVIVIRGGRQITVSENSKEIISRTIRGE
ncbi:MAG: hypothetical protein CL583_13155 [Alteromonadaceae bacterium]|nr:hypothetical protein [Alteromonadaceae bacterium]|tara:strand:- start:17 stop:220 length:204 start_codon:yes stop_codon:yes gene_type:complete